MPLANVVCSNDIDIWPSDIQPARTQSYGTTFLCFSKIDTRVSAHGSRSKSADQSTLSVRRQVVACRSQENECTYSCWLTFLLWQKNESTRRGAMMQTAQAFEATHTTRVQAHDAMHTLTMHDACGRCVGASPVPHRVGNAAWYSQRVTMAILARHRVTYVMCLMTSLHHVHMSQQPHKTQLKFRRTKHLYASAL